MTTGKLFVISAPSGTGKTSLVKALLAKLPFLCVSISHTTRAKRGGEADGVNYYFVNDARFMEMQNQGEFLEHAFIFDHWYGTSKQAVQEKLNAGKHVLLEIDWQGQEQIKSIFKNCISIFIFPPSLEALSERLKNRQEDSPQIITKRLADAKETLAKAENFDFWVINEDFNQALSDLESIIHASLLEKDSQKMIHADILKKLF